MQFGYMRVSSKSQDNKNGEARQREALLAYGIEEKNLFYDVMTGKEMKRPQLEELKKYLRDGDTIVVSELSRLGRDTKGVISIVEEFHERGVTVVSLKENITFDDSPMGRCFLTLVSAFSQLERELINERCQEGREIAKKEGRMGRPRKSDTDKDMLDTALVLYAANQKSVREIAEITGISTSTINREVKKQGVKRLS